MHKLHTGIKKAMRLKYYLTYFIILFSIFIIFLIFINIASISQYSNPNFYEQTVNYISNLYIWLGILAVIGIISIESYVRLFYKNWRYKFTSSELNIEKGIIYKQDISVPYGRIQNLRIQKGILARLFNFSALHIHTAGYSRVYHSEGYIPAMDDKHAKHVYREISKIINQRGN